MSLPVPDYQKLYNSYRKLPSICSLILGILVFAWSIVDVSVFGYHSRYSDYYGIMELRSAVLVLVIWWAIGAILCVLTYYLTSLSISPTIARTDAVLEINQRLNKE